MTFVNTLDLGKDIRLKERTMAYTKLLLLLTLLTPYGNTDTITSMDKMSIARLVSGSTTQTSNLMENIERIEKYFCRDSCGYRQSNVSYSSESTLAQNARITLQDDFFGQVGRCVPCSCKSDCYDKQNCCLFGFEEDRGSNDTIFECLYSDILTKLTGPLSIAMPEARGRSYLMIRRCPANYQIEREIVGKCETPNLNFVAETTPVTSLSTRRIYSNKYCAACNNDSRVQNWEINFVMEPHLMNELSRIASPDDFYKFTLSYVADKKKNNIYFSPISNLPTDPSDECYTADQTRAKCEQGSYRVRYWRELFLPACESNETSVRAFKYKEYYYKNVFCWLCLRPSVSELIRPNETVRSPFTALVTGVAQPETNVKESEEEEGVGVGGCSCREVLNPKEGICLPVLCPIGEYFVACDCVPFLEVTKFYAKLPITVHRLDHKAISFGEKTADSEFMVKFYEKVTAVLQNITTKQLQAETIGWYAIANALEHYYVLLSLIEITESMDTRQTLRDLYEVLETGKSFELDNDTYDLVFEDKYKVGLEPTEYGDIEASIVLTDMSALSHNVMTVSAKPLQMEMFDKFILAEPFRKLMFCKFVCVYSNDSVFEMYTSGKNEEPSNWVVSCKTIENQESRRVCVDDFLMELKENAGQSICGILHVLASVLFLAKYVLC